MDERMFLAIFMILNLYATSSSTQDQPMSGQVKNTILQAGSQLKNGAGTIGEGLLGGALSIGSLPIATAVGKACIDAPLSMVHGITSAAKTFSANMHGKSLTGKIVQFPFEASKFLVNATGRTIKDYAVRSKHLVTNFPLYFSSYWSYRMLQDQQAGRDVSINKALLLGGGLLLPSLLRSASKSENTKKLHKVCEKCGHKIADEKVAEKEKESLVAEYCECGSGLDKKTTIQLVVQ